MSSQPCATAHPSTTQPPAEGRIGPTAACSNATDRTLPSSISSQLRRARPSIRSVRVRLAGPGTSLWDLEAPHGRRGRQARIGAFGIGADPRSRARRSDPTQTAHGRQATTRSRRDASAFTNGRGGRDCWSRSASTHSGSHGPVAAEATMGQSALATRGWLVVSDSGSAMRHRAGRIRDCFRGKGIAPAPARVIQMSPLHSRDNHGQERESDRCSRRSRASDSQQQVEFGLLIRVERGTLASRRSVADRDQAIPAGATRIGRHGYVLGALVHCTWWVPVRSRASHVVRDQPCRIRATVTQSAASVGLTHARDPWYD